MQVRHLAISSALIAATLFSAPIGADFDGGHLLGTVSDVDGRRLAAVEVVLSGSEVAYRVHSDEQGMFQFEDLKPGNYAIELSQEGYSTAIYEPVNVRLGRSTTVQVQMSALIEEVVVVTGEPPTFSAPAGPSSTSYSAEELRIAAADDPWTAVGRAPAVTGGPLHPVAEAAEVPLAATGGSSPRETSFAIDGTVVAENGDDGAISTLALAARGVELERSSGETPGLLVNLVTGRGGDRLRASLRASLSDRDWQGEPFTGSTDARTNRVLDLSEYGAEAGGKLLRDRLFAWGSWQQLEVARQVTGGQVEDTRLEQAVLKLDAELRRGNSAAVAVYRGDRLRAGGGAGPDRALETTHLEEAPSHLLRAEDSQLFGTAFQVSARYAELDTGSDSTPFGGDAADPILGADGIWRGTFADLSSNVETTNWEVEGLAFFDRGKARHTLRFGLGDRSTSSEESSNWGRNNLLHLAGENFGTDFDIVRVVRPGKQRIERDRRSYWLRDSIGMGPVTLDAGLRREVQNGRDAGSLARANEYFPLLLAAVETEGGDSLEFDSLTPSLGFAWALGRQRRTAFRASYSEYSGALHDGLLRRLSPASAELYVAFEDLENNDRFDVTDPYYLLEVRGVDPRQPAASTSANLNHRALQPERTAAMRLALEHTAGPWNFGLHWESRTLSGLHELRRLIRDGDEIRIARADDYSLGAVYSGLLPSGETFAVPTYELHQGLEFTGGSLLTNGDREQVYEDVTMTFHRRLAGRFMVRGQLTASNWRWRVGRGFDIFDDPTDHAPGSLASEGTFLADNDGDVVAQTAGDSLLNSRWRFNVFGLYRVAPAKRWGFDVATNVHGREGYPIAYAVTAVAPDNNLPREVGPRYRGGGSRDEGTVSKPVFSVVDVQTTERSDAFRLDDVYTVDLRLEKEIAIGALRATLSLEGFNLLDSGLVLERETQLNGPQANNVRQTLSPRIFRLGLRLAFD